MRTTSAFRALASIQLRNFIAKLRVKPLTLKTIMLVALVTAQRGQSLHMLDIEFTSVLIVLNSHCRSTSNRVVSRPGYEPPSIMLKAYPADQKLCVFSHMKEYLTRTRPLRGSVTGVFITLVKPYKHVSRDTISRWIRSVMKDAGVDVTQFKPRSFHIKGKSSSCAYSRDPENSRLVFVSVLR